MATESGEAGVKMRYKYRVALIQSHVLCRHRIHICPKKKSTSSDVLAQFPSYISSQVLDLGINTGRSWTHHLTALSLAALQGRAVQK